MSLRRSMIWTLGSLDADAQAFITAAGITNDTEKAAINYLVVNLKLIGVWTKLFALYPFVGSNATSHMYNLKNPLNTDAAFRLTFAGVITHDQNGVNFSLTGWANTHLIPNPTFTNNRECLFLYSRTSAATSSANEVDFGCAVSTTQRDQFVIRSSANGCGFSCNSTSGGGNISVSTNTDGRGFYMGTRETSTSVKLFKNGVAMTATNTALNNGSRSNIKMYLGCRNVANVAQGFTGRNFAMAGMSAEFTTAEAASMYTIVQQFQTYLGRQV